MSVWFRCRNVNSGGKKQKFKGWGAEVDVGDEIIALYSPGLVLTRNALCF